jgi:hypothetical protein
MRQGWYTTDASEVIVAEVNASFRLEHGYSIITQTCDLARPRGAIQIVGHDALSDEEIKTFGGGRSPRYHHVTSALYANFDRVWTVDSDSVDTGQLMELSLEDEKIFRAAAARMYGRLAIPTHVGIALNRLQRYLKDKSKNPDSTPGAMLSRIKEIRISVDPDWAEETPKDTTALWLVLEDAEFPVVEDWAETVSTETLRATLRALSESNNPRASLTSLSGHLNSAPIGTPEREIVWRQIAEEIKRMVAEDFAAAEPPIAEVLVEAETKSRISLNLIEETDRLDLSHLSTDED